MKPFSVAIVSDLLEENWLSMDLVADMLYSQLQKNHLSECHPKQLRPTFSNTSTPSVTRPQFLSNLVRLRNRFLEYPRWLRQRSADYDIFHVIDHSYSQLAYELPADRTMVTCHDLDTFRCLLTPTKEKRTLAFRLMTKRILGGLSRAAHVSCVTETVRSELLRTGFVRPERVSVVHNGVHPSCTRREDPKFDMKVEELLRGPKDTTHYLLHVGSTIPRKRIDILLRVFAEVKKFEQNLMLARVGGPFTAAQEALAKQLGVRNSITVLPHLDRSTLAAVYRHARLLLMTSDAEGFGLPMLEAMACGCPVIASDLDVLREVGGSAAAYCSTEDVPSWAKIVIELLRERKEDPFAWEHRRQNGVSNAARFSWEQSAAKTLQIYKAMVQNRERNNIGRRQ